MVDMLQNKTSLLFDYGRIVCGFCYDKHRATYLIPQIKVHFFILVSSSISCYKKSGAVVGYSDVVVPIEDLVN